MLTSKEELYKNYVEIAGEIYFDNDDNWGAFPIFCSKKTKELLSNEVNFETYETLLKKGSNQFRANESVYSLADVKKMSGNSLFGEDESESFLFNERSKQEEKQKENAENEDFKDIYSIIKQIKNIGDFRTVVLELENSDEGEKTIQMISWLLRKEFGFSLKEFLYHSDNAMIDWKEKIILS